MRKSIAGNKSEGTDVLRHQRRADHLSQIEQKRARRRRGRLRSRGAEEPRRAGRLVLRRRQGVPGRLARDRRLPRGYRRSRALQNAPARKAGARRRGRPGRAGAGAEAAGEPEEEQVSSSCRAVTPEGGGQTNLVPDAVFRL